MQFPTTHFIDLCRCENLKLQIVFDLYRNPEYLTFYNNKYYVNKNLYQSANILIWMVPKKNLTDYLSELWNGTKKPVKKLWKYSNLHSQFHIWIKARPSVNVLSCDNNNIIEKESIIEINQASELQMHNKH